MLTQKQHTEICKMFLKKKRYSEIAKKYKVNPETVRQIIFRRICRDIIHKTRNSIKTQTFETRKKNKKKYYQKNRKRLIKKTLKRYYAKRTSNK